MQTAKDVQDSIRSILLREESSLNTLRNIIVGGLIIAGVASMVGSWVLDGKSALWSGILANLGCEFIGSIAILLALDYIEKRKNMDAELDQRILEQIRLISDGRIALPENPSLPVNNPQIQGESDPPPELFTKKPRTR